LLSLTTLNPPYDYDERELCNRIGSETLMQRRVEPLCCLPNEPRTESCHEGGQRKSSRGLNESEGAPRESFPVGTVQCNPASPLHFYCMIWKRSTIFTTSVMFVLVLRAQHWFVSQSEVSIVRTRWK
jgi:hypothetical protein